MTMNSQQRAGTTHSNIPTNYHTPSTSKHSASPSAEQVEPSHKHNKSFQVQDKHANKNKPLPACAICLSHTPHSAPVINSTDPLSQKALDSTSAPDGSTEMDVPTNTPMLTFVQAAAPPLMALNNALEL
ncbi:hypothetical protein V8B97DRAFT_2004293 [Scleroderma yunnanense]